MDTHLLQTTINAGKDAISLNALPNQSRLRKCFLALAVSGAYISLSSYSVSGLSHDQNEAMIRTFIPLAETQLLNDIHLIKFENVTTDSSINSAPKFDTLSLASKRDKLRNALDAYSEALTPDQRWTILESIRIIDQWLNQPQPLTPNTIHQNMAKLSNVIASYCDAFDAQENGIGLFCDSSDDYYSKGGYVEKKYRERHSHIRYKVSSSH